MSSDLELKREGTGMSGHLFEIKFAGFVFYNAMYDKSIKQFQLASNVSGAGAFDDICLKAEVNGFSKPLIAFIQCKHKEDSKKSPDVALNKYFFSFLKIREKFKSQDDPGSLFHGDFQDTQPSFVIYTNGKEPHPIDNVAVEGEGDLAKLNELIDTGGIARRPYKNRQDKVDFLCEKLAKDRTISLAKQMATFMGREMTFQDLLSDKYNIILLYHVYLAQSVFDLSEIKPEGHRVATFCQDFFDTTDEYLTLFKDTLFQEILKRRRIKPYEINKLLSDFIAEPTDVTKLSKLIGTVVTYKNGQLEFVEKYSKYSNQNLNQGQITRWTVNEAVKLATKDIVTKVPTAFGNKDLTFRTNDENTNQINDLKSKIIDKLDKFKQEKLIVIDKSIEEAFLELNGGIAGAIGNIFVPDHNTKYMKITDSCESLGTLAKSLYTKLVTEIHNLHEYRFCFDVKNVPRFSLDPSDYDKSLAGDFLNNLLFCSKQADEKKLEKMLKDLIRDYQRCYANHFQAFRDAIYLTYQDILQKWRQDPLQKYLTKGNNIFEEAINRIMNDSLMSAINLTYMNKIQHFKYTFREDVVSSWRLQDHSTTVIITENSLLTVVKVLQHLKNKDHAVLDLEYIVSLPTHDRNILCAELTKTNEHKAHVFVCDKLQNETNEIKPLETIGEALLKKKTIIITSLTSLETLQKYFPTTVSIVKDENNSLIDMSEASQKSILDTRVIFQGTEVRLNQLLDDESKAYVNRDVLYTIISKETIKISKLTLNRQYNEIKKLYVDRNVIKTNSVARTPNNSLLLKTLFDIEDDVVLITGEPGMGKSTLLSHISLKTKTKRPRVWIARVNLLNYSSKLREWQDSNTIIDTLETTKFLCQVMLAEKLDGKQNNVKFELEEDNGVVYLTQCTGDQLTDFELKLFLNFYNKGGIIFIFDGFDEICPHYMHEVIQCIETINSHTKNHKIWVTSRSYTEIINCLQRTFGEPYIIEHLSNPAKTEYLMKIWQSNLKLEKLNKVQLQNVHDLLMFVIENKPLQMFELPLQDIYIEAANYIINEIKTTSIPLWTFNDNYTEHFHTMKKEFDDVFDMFVQDANNNPLNLYHQALFVINRIKNDSHSTNKWNRDVNVDDFYREFIETKLKSIRFQGKNNMNTDYPDIRNSYDNELANLIAMHKELAAYAIFNEDKNKLFSKQDLEKIEKTIKFIEIGGEKTGLINIVYGIPIFIHMTYTEYLSVEYVCHLLKHENESNNILKLMDFIFNEMFSTSDEYEIIFIFDHKMKIDKKLMSIMKNHDEEIFNLIIEQGKHKDRTSKWPPSEAIECKLHNFKSLFLAIFERYVNENNLKEFLNVVNKMGILRDAIMSHYDEFFVCVINKVKVFDVSILNDVLCQNFGCLYRSWNHDLISSEDLAQLIRNDLPIWKAETQPIFTPPMHLRRLIDTTTDMVIAPGMQQPQQRGMGGGGVMTGVPVGTVGLVPFGLLGYPLGGGFSSSPNVQATEFSESVDFGGDDWME